MQILNKFLIKFQRRQLLLGYLIILCFLFSKNSLSQDIAVHSKYFLSSFPNYPLSASNIDTSALTDGVYTNGYFFTQKTTVGWENIFNLRIEIDLGSIKKIGSIFFNSGQRKEAGVYFPRFIYVFTSIDGRNFLYQGNAGLNGNLDSDTYTVKRLTLENINSLGRYVYLSVIPNGHYIFCDEIGILKANEFVQNSNSFIPISFIGNYIDSLNLLNSKISSFNKGINEIYKLISPNDEKKEKIDVNNHNLGINNHDLNNLVNKNNERIIRAFNLLGNSIERKYGSRILFTKIGPWDSLSEYFMPSNDFDLNFNVNAEIGRNEYLAVAVTNGDPLISKVKLIVTDSGINNSEIQSFYCDFRLSNEGDAYADALIPLGDSFFSLPFGTTKFIFFKISPFRSGESRFKISVTSGIQSFYFPIIINSKGNPLNIKSIYANNWAYLNFNLINDRIPEAIRDLRDHHINVMVIPENFIPVFGNNNWESFQHYLQQIKGFKIYLLFLDFGNLNRKNPNPAYKFLSNSWKRGFLDWYKKLVQKVNEEGIGMNQIYLYPYDEIKNPEINDFLKFIMWTKREIPSLKIYATIDNYVALKRLFPFLDIAQILDQSRLINNIPMGQCQKWLYDVKENSKSLSPYRYYRLMAWRAFVNKFNGIGFWNYADLGHTVNPSLNSNLPDSWDDYSVIYQGPSKSIISSRRWEAFKFGIEDYQILENGTIKMGNRLIFDLAKRVIENPQKTYLADSVRQVLIGH